MPNTEFNVVYFILYILFLVASLLKVCDITCVYILFFSFRIGGVLGHKKHKMFLK